MEPPEKFRTSTAPGALRLACFSTAHEAEDYFRQAKLPFRPDLLRYSGGRICHVLYAPTVPGFRADPEDTPVSGLLFDVDLLTFLAKSTRNHGDSLDIAKAILSGSERRLSVVLGVNMVHPDHLYQEAIQFHFGNLKHDFRLRKNSIGR